MFTLMNAKFKYLNFRSAKREVTVEISSENFIRTGINCDICQVN